MKINPLFNIKKTETVASSKQDIQAEQTNYSAPTQVGLQSKFNDHLLAFKGRVDKGLDRFYDANKNRMPSTVRRYVEALEDKSRLTPIEAQQRAFNKLPEAKTIADIKNAYPDEELFKELITTEQSKAKRGILNSIRENKELMELYGNSVLKDDSDLTVYLVKKVFLESKTIDEINADLENDINEDFKADFKHKNKDSKFVYGSTLRSLGIQLPNFEYMQSLRYTRDGYSDKVGEKISEGQIAFWESLSDEERTARAKKSVKEFENWWNSYTINQKLDMIADKMTTLDMLKDFKKSAKKEAKQNNRTQEPKTENQHPKKHTKVGSEKLSKDELFIKWATANLKIFEETLTEADKDSLHIKRMQRLAQRWASMTATEKTDYINKMKAGSEPIKFAMIDAWNHSKNLIKDLSLHLRANQIYKPSDVLYSSQEFSEFQSRLMTQFWDEHPQYANELGNNIIRSTEKVQDAITRGTFEELKRQILRDKSDREKEINKFRIQTKPEPPKTNNTVTNTEFSYLDEFKKLYLKTTQERMHYIPNEYLDKYFESIKDLPKEYVLSWIKNLKGEYLTPQDKANLNELLKAESEKSCFEPNRTLEATLANVLYAHTKNPSVYELSFSDLKGAIYKLEKGQNPITFYSMKLQENFILPVVTKVKLNKTKIEADYKNISAPLSHFDIDNILHCYFTIDKDFLEKNKDNPTEAKKQIEEAQQKLYDYIKKYNQSIFIIFSGKSMHSPEVKDKFYKKFVMNMPKDIITGPFKPNITSLEDFRYEQKLKEARYAYAKKYDFVPTIAIDSIFDEMSKIFRENKKDISLDTVINQVCKKRTSEKDAGKSIYYPKTDMHIETKLKSLAIEQALADVLYEATGNTDVYSFPFEVLCDNLEVFKLVKKFPSIEKRCPATHWHKETILVAKKRPNLSRINQLYKDYLNEIQIWCKEIANHKIKADFEDLLYILNPEENNPMKDIAVAERMGLYAMAPEKITITPNKN